MPRTDTVGGVHALSVAHGGAQNTGSLAAHQRCCCALSPELWGRTDSALRGRNQHPPAHLVWTISLTHTES